MAVIIQAENLTKTYNDIIAVDGISFTVRTGEVFGFLGPNGAGKTTTMKMIACVSPRSSGALAVFDKDPEQHPTEIKQKIGVVPQETNLDPDFSCSGNLTTYARYFDILPIPDPSAKIMNNYGRFNICHMNNHTMNHA